MPIYQTYYTSCEHGLSGRPGYQFNAVTPGVPVDTLADVEAMTTYSPPSSVPYGADPAAIAGAPVKLCYRRGPNTVLANVVFVGADYSQRFGNYFAHALVTADVGADLGAVLPIELWRARFWGSRPVADSALPTLSVSPEDAILTRSAVAEFVGNHRCTNRIGALVSAIALAVNGNDRKVVIVERTADDAAHWIAAASYLLPSELVLRMSFATYEHQPSFSKMNVVGTVPEAGFDSGAATFEANFVFDMVTDRASQLDAHPLGELLADIGVEAASDAWSRSRTLATGTEADLDDWHPLLAATVVGTGLGYAEDAAVAADWLGVHAERLGTEKVADIGNRVLPLLSGVDDPIRALTALGTAARAVHADELVVRVEVAQARRLLDGDLELLREHAIPFRSSEARAMAEETLHRRLADASAEEVAALLGWARGAGVRVFPEVLHVAGQRRVGAAVLAGPDERAWEALLRNWPALSAGVVDHLCGAANTRLADVVSVLTGPYGELPGVRDRLELRTAVSVAAVRAEQQSPVDAMVRIARDQATIREDVLDLLWPDGEWTVDEACDIVLRTDPAVIVHRAVVDRLARLLAATSATTSDGLDRLRSAVAESPVLDRLPERVRHDVHNRWEADLIVQGLVATSRMTGKKGTRLEFRRQLDDLAVRYRRFSVAKRDAVARQIVAQATHIAPEDLTVVFLELTKVWDVFASTLREREPAIAMIARLLGVLGECAQLQQSVPSTRGLYTQVEKAANEAMTKLRRKDIRNLLLLLERQDAPERVTTWVRHWAQEHSRLWPRWLSAKVARPRTKSRKRR